MHVLVFNNIIETGFATNFRAKRPPARHEFRALRVKLTQLHYYEI